MRRPTFIALLVALAMPAHAGVLFGRLRPPPPATEANGPSTSAEVSGDGRVFVFESGATNWVPGSITGGKIVAVDYGTGSVEILSLTSAGVAFNASSFSPSTAGGGRYVVFETLANNLGFGFTTSGFQVVRKDRATGQLALASSDAGGAPATGTASGQARNASVSADGRFVAFRSDATNLVAGTGGNEHIFVKDLQTGAIELASRTASGAIPGGSVVASTAHSLSADGRFLVFQTNAAGIVAGNTGGTILVYVRDRATGTNTLASVATGGAAANSQSDNAAISPDGRFVSFRSFASNLGGSGFVSRVFVHDRTTGTTTPVPLPVVNGSTASGCRESDVSNAGTVVMGCFFPNVADQVFLHAIGQGGAPVLVSGLSGGVPGNQSSAGVVAIDASGASLAFQSVATNLEDGDTNGVSDIFVLADAAVLDGLFADGFE